MNPDKNNCCFVGTRKKKCIRQDGKVFGLPRRFTRKKCLTMKVRGFSMKSSCAPYKYCKRIRKRMRKRTRKRRIKGGNKKRKGRKTRIKKEKGRDKGKSKKQFLFNPNDPSKSFDVYIDKNPNDIIPIKYKTLEDVRDTVDKLEKLYKAGKYSHKRIWQVGMIMYVR